jgi:hypothetical protein
MQRQALTTKKNNDRAKSSGARPMEAKLNRVAGARKSARRGHRKLQQEQTQLKNMDINPFSARIERARGRNFDHDKNETILLCCRQSTESAVAK